MDATLQTFALKVADGNDYDLLLKANSYTWLVGCTATS